MQVQFHSAEEFIEELRRDAGQIDRRIGDYAAHDRERQTTIDDRAETVMAVLRRECEMPGPEVWAGVLET